MNEIGLVDSKKAKERFEWLTAFLVVNYRFVHQILQLMNKVEDNQISSVGVTVVNGRLYLHYNPHWFGALSDEEAIFVLFHEVLHVALHHCTRRQLSCHKIANIAHDLAVNELIEVHEGSCEPPKKDGKLIGVFVSELKKDPAFADIRPKQSAEWYYNYLQKQQMFALQGTFDDHSGWTESEVAELRIRLKVEEIARNNQWGNMSRGLQEIITAAQKHRIKWQQIIRSLVGNQLWRGTETTRRRPNRRTGYMHPGLKRIRVNKVLVAVDTSISISSTRLAEFLGVLNTLTDFPIDLVQFDAEITSGPVPFFSRQTEMKFIGRGGTSFAPVIKLASERKYRSLIILTDGAADPPPKPDGVFVTWVLPASYNPPVSWGYVVHMDA